MRDSLNPKSLLIKGVKLHRWGGLHTFSHKGDEGCYLKEHYLHSAAALWLMQNQHLSAARQRLWEVERVQHAPTVTDTSANE